MRETEKAINLGRLQTQFETTARAAKAAERALKRAQEARDTSRAQAVAAETALRDATRTVLG